MTITVLCLFLTVSLAGLRLLLCHLLVMLAYILCLVLGRGHLVLYSTLFINVHKVTFLGFALTKRRHMVFKYFFLYSRIL